MSPLRRPAVKVTAARTRSQSAQRCTAAVERDRPPQLVSRPLFVLALRGAAGHEQPVELPPRSTSITPPPPRPARLTTTLSGTVKVVSFADTVSQRRRVRSERCWSDFVSRASTSSIDVMIHFLSSNINSPPRDTSKSASAENHRIRNRPGVTTRAPSGTALRSAGASIRVSQTRNSAGVPSTNSPYSLRAPDHSAYFPDAPADPPRSVVALHAGAPTILSPPAAVRVRGSHAGAPLVDRTHAPQVGRLPTAEG